MAHSGKTITFATDLLPNEDNIYNLGIDGQKWKIRGDITSDKVTTFKLATPLTNGSRTAQVETSPYQGTLWKFNASLPVSSLVTGDTIIIKTPGAGGSYGVFLSLDNGTTYRPISMSGASRLTTHFSSGVMLILTYNASGSVNTMRGKVDANGTLSTTTGDNTVSGGRWEIMNLYDSGNSNDTSVMYIRVGSATYKTTTKYQRYVLSLIKNETHIIPLNIDKNNDNHNGTTTNNHTLTTDVFDITSYIFVYNTNNASYAANATVGASNLWYGHAAVDMRYSFNITTSTFTAHKNVYIKASLQSATTAKLCTEGNPVTQTLPSTKDNYIYILIGRAYDGYRITLFDQHPIYYYDGTTIREFSPINTIGTAKGDMVYWTSENNPARLAIGTAGHFLKATDDGPAWSALPTASTSAAGIIQIGTGSSNAMAGNTTVTNVSYTATTDNASYPILLKNSTGSTTTAASVKFNTGVTVNPSTGTVYATAFNGPLTGDVTGNADTATKANLTTTSNTLSYYTDGTGAFGNASKIMVYHDADVTVQSATKKRDGLRFYGSTYGNTATDLTSNTAGVIQYEDGGVRLEFSASATGGSDNGALIFTNHDSANTGGGSSFHFVGQNGSNNTGGNLAVTAPDFVARRRMAVGYNFTDTNYALKVNGASYLGGPLKIGAADAADNTGYATANVGSQNYIAFYGVYNDNPGGFNHTYIGESIYGSKTAANEQSELLLFHGNDPGSGSGPDRIRLFAGQIDICVYTAATSGTWDTIRQTAGTKVANFANGQVTITGNLLPEANNTRNVGSSSVKWANVYATTFTGSLTGNVTGNCTGNAGSASTVSAKLVTNKKIYFLGTETTITGTAANVSLEGDTGVYLTTTAGELSAARHSWNVSGTEKAYTTYNSTDNSIDFIFL